MGVVVPKVGEGGGENVFGQRSHNELHCWCVVV